MGNTHNPFPRIREAREYLKNREKEILDAYIDNALAAKDEGDREVASEALKWLIEHMPTNPGEDKLIDTSVDKIAKDSSKQSGPSINIGFALGGVAETRMLPEVIEIKKDE